jgi:hypothetical protein
VLEKRADLVTGTLVVFAQADPKVQSASVATTGELPAVVEAATPPAQPPKVTLRVQRLLPAGARDNWRIETQPLVWTPGTKLDALVLLSSGSGHSMKAGLSEPQGHQPIPEGMVEQKLVVKDLDAVGSYAGSLFVKSGTTDKIDVEAKVRDIILWPLIVVGIAALIGGFGVTRAQRWRSRQILRAELGRVRRDYETRKDAAQIGPPLGDDAEQTLTALEQAVSNAKSEEELDAVTERIRAARKAIDAWIVLDQAARALRTLQDKAPDVREVAQDTQEALDAAEWIPDDEAEAAKRLTQLRRQAAIVRAFHAAYDRWPPAAIKAYGEAKGAFATDLETGRLIGRLERVVKESQAIRELPEAAQEARVAEFAAELDQVVEADFGQIAMHGADWRRGVTEIRLTPEQLERSVRRWDWVLGSITFAVTVFLFVLGIYDDDFGTWDDYAKAFAAGFLGQVGGAAVWNLLPPLRSYGIPVPKPAK